MSGDKFAEGIRRMSERLDGLRKNTERFNTADQKHLDKGTTERAYYHLGYTEALKDALNLLQKGTGSA